MSRKSPVPRAVSGIWTAVRTALILFVATSIIATIVGITVPSATPEGIAAGLSALIALNAVVLALVYTTTQRTAVLSLRGDVGWSFFEWVG